MSDKKTLKWIRERSKSQRGNIALLVALNVLFSMLLVGFALAIKTVIDGAIEGAKTGETTKLIVGASVLVAIIFLQFLLRFSVNYLAEKIKAKLELEYREYIFDQILKKKYSEINRYHSGELINRITADVSVVSESVSSIVPSVVAAVARLVFAVAALIYLDWIFAIAFTVAGILVFSVISIMRKKLKSLHKGVQETDGKARSFMQECIENLLAIKAFSVNSKIEKKEDELLEEHLKVKMKRASFSVIGNATYNFIFSAGYAFALIYGAVKILGGVLTYGSLSAILQLVNNVQVPFASLSEAVPRYFSMLASAERLIEIEEVEEENVEQVISADDTYLKMRSLVIKDLSFAYDRQNVLENVNAVINKGDFAMIEGSSGIGKSTLIKLLLGVYPPTGGEIYFDTGSNKTPVFSGTRSMFSYVPQGNMVFSGTIKENVSFTHPEATEEEIDRALYISHSKEFIEELPNGIETVIGEKGAGLSEGQVQRIAIARAILSKAPIVILDEATSALDEETEKKVLENLKGIKNVTLIIISHKKAAQDICNRKFKVSKKRLFEVV